MLGARRAGDLPDRGPVDGNNAAEGRAIRRAGLAVVEQNDTRRCRPPRRGTSCQPGNRREPTEHDMAIFLTGETGS
jgi:hypothetical protein